MEENMLKKMLLIVFILLMLLATGCMNLQIEVDVDYPSRLFKKTVNSLEKMAKKDPFRRGRVSRLNVLIYSGDERKLIRFSLPISLVDSAIDEGISQKSKIRKYGKNYVNINLEGLDGLKPLGPGLLAELEVREEKTHIILWLD
jgi:hypothetical protein